MSSKDDLGWSRTIVSCCIQQLLHSTELLSHIDGSFHLSEVYQPDHDLSFLSYYHRKSCSNQYCLRESLFIAVILRE